MALICDNTKAKKLLGWEPKYTLEQGLSLTIDYIRDHLNCYKPALFNR
jgi:dTDP-glucose 4,6-dehydratase